MRILLIAQYFLPEPQKLVAELAMTLRDRGHSVAVLTGFPHWPQGRLYPGYRIKTFDTEDIQGVTVYRVPIYPDHSRSALKRALNAGSYTLSGMTIAPWKLPRFDVIHAISPPFTMFPALVPSRRWRVPYTYEVQDMFPETLSSAGMMSSRPLLAGIGRIINVLYARAAAIRVISPGARRNLESKGVPSERIHEISNWVDADFYTMAPRDRDGADPSLRGKFNVVFAGNMGLAQGLEVVLRAARELSDLPNVNFVFVGDGVELPRLKQIQEREGIRNVVFLGRFPPEQMPGILAQAEVLLVHLRDDPAFRMTIPLKTLTYLATGRPILASAAGDTADVIEKTGAGITCDPRDPSSLAAAVRTLYSMPRSRLEELGKNGRHAARTMYSRDLMVGKVESMLLSVVSGDLQRRTAHA